jgi:hypothetical protein
MVGERGRPGFVDPVLDEQGGDQAGHVPRVLGHPAAQDVQCPLGDLSRIGDDAVQVLQRRGHPVHRRARRWHQRSTVLPAADGEDPVRLGGHLTGGL